jgi:hypothetical protein
MPNLENLKVVRHPSWMKKQADQRKYNIPVYSGGGLATISPRRRRTHEKD